MNIFIIGCAYTGLAAAKYWKSKGHFVTATTTRESRVEELAPHVDEVVVMRGSDLEKMCEVLPKQDIVLVSVAGGMVEKDGKVVLDEDAYRDTYFGTAETIVKALEDAPNVKQIIFPSSTSAYGDGFGKDVVTEEDDTNPQSVFHQIYVDAENKLLSAETENRKICIFRTGNIYGIGRELKMQAKAMAGKQVPLDGDAGVMIVHRDDVVRACDFAVENELTGIFNLVNDRTESKSEFFGAICEQENLDKIEWLSFAKGVKNASNQNLKNTGFGFVDANAEKENKDLI